MCASCFDEQKKDQMCDFPPSSVDAPLIASLAMNITADVFRTNIMNGEEYVRCNRCGHGGCDIRVSGCGCTLHAVSLSFQIAEK
jgi:hypothetical protein